MLYRFAWVMMWITFKIFFRRIDLVGLEKLHSGKPAIIIANHPASFLDAMVLAVFLRRSIHFYVRGDIFAHPLAYRLLTWLHMIPIFSREHGIGNLSNNKKTFERGRKLLEEGKLLLIFPEGFSRQSKQLEPFKKGAARVALQTAFEGGKMNDLQIQTVALNYSCHNLGANLLIRLGDAITLEHYEKQYQDFPAMAITQLNKAMSAAFQQNVICLQDGNRTDLAEVLIRMHYNNTSITKLNLFADFRKICERVDGLPNQVFTELVKEVADYEASLHALKITDQSVVDSRNQKNTNNLWIVLFFTPLAVIGKISWWLPARLSIWIADKTVTRIDFYTSVLSGVLGFTGFLWWVLLLTGTYNLGWYYMQMIVIILPLFSYIYMQWEVLYKNRLALIRLRQLKKVKYEQIEQLLQQRSRIAGY
jgi:glycerol-3-phosphate O-acyltransferase/dihydroxyacetone phosphate acyltransferase